MLLKNRIELAKYFNELGFKTGAEIGVFDGRYSEILCQNIPELKLLCVDIWRQNRIFELAKKKLAPYNTILIKKSSMDAVKEVHNESLDFVFIDANHRYGPVKEDIREWTKKVRKGGIVAGHDYYIFRYSGNRGVIGAVDEYVKENGYKLCITSKDGNNDCKDDRQPSWFFIK